MYVYIYIYIYIYQSTDLSNFLIPLQIKPIDKIWESQSNLRNLDNTQVELYLLRSCQNVYKVNHILRTNVPTLLLKELNRFDQGLRLSLEIICRSSVTDMA